MPIDLLSKNLKSLALISFLIGWQLPAGAADQIGSDDLEKDPALEKPPAAALIGPGQSHQIKENDDLLDVDAWTRLYNSGLKAKQNRMFAEAEQKLILAIKEAKRGSSDDTRLISTRNALGDVYCHLDKFGEAEKLYSWTYGAARRVMGAESDAVGTAAYGLALVYYVHGNYARAATLCKESITARRKALGATHHDVGESYVLMALILGKQNWPDEAEPYLTRGLRILEKSPGTKQLDYADALRLAALYRQGRGQKGQAEQLFEKAYELHDAAVAFDQPSKLKGVIRYRWEEGSPRAQEIPDNDFPLRYVNLNGVRVAATVIDLWELAGVLISITNTGDERIILGLDKVTLEKLSEDPFNTQRQVVEAVNPYNIDRIRRERGMWDLTMNRPWLANIQKTRSVRGLVPAHGHDLFRGPNIFGIYGDWGAVSRVMPETLASQPSPERVQYQAEHTVDGQGLIRSNTIKTVGMVPVSLEPFESRTGELFYIHPRCDILLTVRVGNTSVEIPFHTRKRRIL